MPLPVALGDVVAARDRIGGRIRRTPLVALEGTPLLLKAEGLQETGSFKYRGATNAVLGLAPTGVVTSSSGNHGRALAAAARHAAIRAVVVMPADATDYKRANVRAEGATIVDCESGTAVREHTTAEVAKSEGLTVIPPYDHPLVIAGQGTCGLEIVDDVPDLAAVVVPLGGGGLLSGVATAVKGSCPHVRVIGVEPEDGDDFVRSRGSGRRETVPVPLTMCDGARTQTPGVLTWPIVEALVDDLMAVTDEEVIAALRLLARSGLWVEPTGALAVAGALRLGLGAGTVCIVSGRNVAPAALLPLLAQSAGPSRTNT